MPEYRHDPISDRWVIFAPERLGRPDQFSNARPPRRIVTPCPFCAGHEDDTPPELTRYAAENASGRDSWQVRVVPNKYPAVRIDGTEVCGNSAGTAPGFGAHEVIIESPIHVVSFSELTDDQATFTFRAYRDRIRSLKQDSRLAYACGGRRIAGTRTQSATGHIQGTRRGAARVCPGWRASGTSQNLHLLRNVGSRA